MSSLFNYYSAQGERGYTQPYELATVGEPGFDGMPGAKGERGDDGLTGQIGDIVRVRFYILLKHLILISSNQFRRDSVERAVTLEYLEKLAMKEKLESKVRLERLVWPA